MSFVKGSGATMDQTIRNKLRSVVTQCRKLLEEAVRQVLQGQFGIYETGKKDEVHVEDEGRMKNFSDEDKCYRRDIQAHLGHIEALGYKAKDALAQLVREIAFTHLNRLCAYKMMEARAVWIGGKPFREAVSRGMKSQGFLFYLADHPEDKTLFDTGHQDVAYRHFLGWLGANLSEEIGVLFSPTDPANRLFPPQRVLDDVLALLNSDDLKDIWAVDETIGWVYQYFTPKELRDQVRKESAAPSHADAGRNTHQSHPVDGYPPLETNDRVARVTNGTNNDPRWIRAWWEVSPFKTGRKNGWVPHAKGGAYAPYYADLHLVVGWDNEGGTYPGYTGTSHRPDLQPASSDYFFRPGITWPRRTTGLSFRILPKQAIFGNKGPAIFSERDDDNDLLAVCSLANSKPFLGLIQLQLARVELAQSYETGIIRQTPAPQPLPSDLATLASRIYALRVCEDSCNELSHAFLAPAMCVGTSETLAGRCNEWNRYVSTLLRRTGLCIKKDRRHRICGL